MTADLNEETDFFAGLRAYARETGRPVVADWVSVRKPKGEIGHVLFLCPADREARAGLCVEVATVLHDPWHYLAYWDLYAKRFGDPLLVFGPVEMP
jgi:hypothetical protein